VVNVLFGGGREVVARKVEMGAMLIERNA